MPEHQQTQQSTESKTTFQKQSTPIIQTTISNPMAIIQRARINPKSLTHADVMQLQRTIGNRAVGRLFSELGLIPSSAKQAPPVQRQEIPEEEEPLQSKMTETIQRQTIPEEEPLQGKMIKPVQRQEIPEEEEPLQGKFENKPEQMTCLSCFAVPIVQRQELEDEEKPLQGKMIETVQRQEIPEEEEPLQGKLIEPIQRQEPEEDEKLQMKSVVQRQELPEDKELLQGKFESKLEQTACPSCIQRKELEEEEPLQKKSENNTGMPDNLKAGVENLSGIDMSDVRVQYNSSKPAEVGALAYTQGTNIHVAPGQEKHLPHEAWHVVQQKQRRVKPTIQSKGVSINDEEGLEREADVMGWEALQKYAQVEKPKENKSRAVASSTAQKKNGSERSFDFVDNRLEVITQRKLQRTVKQKHRRVGLTMQMEMANEIQLQPIQAVRFSRLLSHLYYTDAERSLIEFEKAVQEFYASMEPFAARFPEIIQIGTDLDGIKDENLAEADYEDARSRLSDIKEKLDDISVKISAVGLSSGEEMMKAYGTHAKDSKVGSIIQIYLDTISVLPACMKSEENYSAIKSAIHPDVDTIGIGFTEDSLGKSDVEFAKYRHKQIVENLFALNSRIIGDWPDLQRKFQLFGGLKHISLTGSDLHKGGQQVVIIESEGGQKLVYKPRSVAPDAALMDASTGVFAFLNNLPGLNLPTLKFHTSKEKGAYVEFVEHNWVKTKLQIKQYYTQLGQLVVAAKLFGVNDLHYENIMAASNGPTIIDAETSFLMNVMNARDFKSNELQMGAFTHVSEIDNKLSNNAFYTLEEKKEWDDRAADEHRSWDQFIGDKRDADVKPGGPYEEDFKAGMGNLLKILVTDRDSIINQLDYQVKAVTDVRVVPIGTSIFKILLNFYRDHRRRDNTEGMKESVLSGVEQVKESLIKKKYTLLQPTEDFLVAQLTEDFDNGDIPLLHYNGKINKLTWNEKVIGFRQDYEESKTVISENIKWLVMQTVDDVLKSFQ